MPHFDSTLFWTTVAATAFLGMLTFLLRVGSGWFTRINAGIQRNSDTQQETIRLMAVLKTDLDAHKELDETRHGDHDYRLRRLERS